MTDSVVTGATNVNIKSHGYYSYRFQIRKNLDVTNIVVPGPTYVAIKIHGYCSHRFNIGKYLEVTDIVVTGPTHVNILKSRILYSQVQQTLLF